MSFLLFMGINAVIAYIIVPLSLKYPNPMLIRCPACGSKLYSRPSTKRWAWVDTMVWCAMGWFIIWRHHFPVGYSVALFFVTLVAWNATVNRVVHAYWMWRHPVRCQGGGHVAPLPQGS